MTGCAALDQWRVRPGLGTFSVTMHGSRSHLTDVLSIPGIPRSKLHTVSNLLAAMNEDDVIRFRPHYPSSAGGVQGGRATFYDT